MKNLKTMITSMSVYRDGDSPIFGESATHLRIEDEADGMFLIVTQDTDGAGTQELRFDFDEFEQVYKTYKELTQQGEFKWGLPDDG